MLAKQDINSLLLKGIGISLLCPQNPGIEPYSELLFSSPPSFPTFEISILILLVQYFDIMFLQSFDNTIQCHNPE